MPNRPNEYARKASKAPAKPKRNAAAQSQEQAAQTETTMPYAGLFKKPTTPTAPSAAFVTVEAPAKEDKTAGTETANAWSCAMM